MSAVKTKKSSPPPQQQFYAVYVPGNSPSSSEKSVVNESRMVFREMAEVLEAMKKHKDKNPRFKNFSCYDEAERFAVDGGCDDSSSFNSTDKDYDGEQRPPTPRPPPPAPADELPRPYPALSRPELTEFKKAIESKNAEKVQQLIEANPRYLINCNGDTPTILQEGFRYNALHVATRVGHLATAKAVLEQFTEKNCAYVRRLYPDDKDEQTTSNRRCLLLDFYLNTPDKGFNDTPLHFAAKNGFVDLIEYLCSFDECQRTLVNKNGQTPKDYVKESERVPEKTKKQIVELLDRGPPVYYVPLYRARDEANAPILRHPAAGFPATRLTLDENNSGSKKETDYRLAAYIGPVNAEIANHLYSQWASNNRSPPSTGGSTKKKSSKKLQPVNNTISNVAAIKRSDLHKGMERIGRQVAGNGNHPWMEYWNFLGEFVDLRNENGLKQLEQYFRQKTAQEDENFKKTLASKLLGQQNSSKHRVSEPNQRGDWREACQRKLDFSDTSDECHDDESSKDSSDLYFDAQSDDENGAGDIKSANSNGLSISAKTRSEAGDDGETRDGYFTPPQQLTAKVIFGQDPTKLDRDVYSTLENVKIDEDRYPRTAAWLKMIRDYPDEERSQWVPLDSPRSASAIRQQFSNLRALD